MHPTLTVFGRSPGNPRAVVVVLHGGRAVSTAPAPRGGAWARMIPFAFSASRLDHVTAWLVRYRLRGWNAPALDPVRDARWVLSEARRRHPDTPIVLVGHSMGGRVALRLAAEPGITGVCALAPWIERGDPVVQTVPGAVLIVHGLRDRVTDPSSSEDYALRTGASFVPISDDGHAMLRRAALWHRLTTGFVNERLTTRHPG